MVKKLMLNHTKWFYFTLFVILSIITCFLQPHDDDWQYLYYFDCPVRWGFSNYEYVKDCILLPGSYWRPLWSIFNRMEAMLLPNSMPYANHIFISFGMVGIAYQTFLLCLKLSIKRIISIVISLVLIFATTSMGAMLSVDSFQNVYAAFFGLMSCLVYVNTSGWKKWILWFIFGWLAAMGKETGFVWFVVAPIFSEIVRQKTINGIFKFSLVKYGEVMPKVIISFIPIILYLGLYISLKPEMLNNVGFVSDQNTTIQTVSESNNKSMLETMTEMEEHNSYKLSPSTLVKNVAVLYVLGIVPVDTVSVYFKNYALLIVTVILSLIWIVCISRDLLKFIKRHWEETLVVLLLAFWVSGPSLVTRAGEISPIIHMSIVALFFAMFFNKIKYSKKVIVGTVCFIAATLLTDCHKYFIAYKAGEITRNMARSVVEKTKVVPQKVLLVQVDDFSKKKSGAFMINPADGIRKGSAMIREYDYKYPNKLDYISIPDDAMISHRVDSLVNIAKGNYDCVWFCHDINTEVYNLK